MPNLSAMQEILNIAKDEGIKFEDLDNQDSTNVLLLAILKEFERANELRKETIKYNIKLRQGCL